MMKVRGFFSASVVRFKVLGVRSGMVNFNSSNDSLSWPAFGLLKDGCCLSESGRISSSLQGSGQENHTGKVVESIVENGALFFKKTVEANGYFFITSDGDVGLDPVQWELQVSSDSSSWHTVGASAWREDPQGRLEFFPQIKFDTPTLRGQQVKVDMRLRWPKALRSFLIGFVWSTTMFSLMAAGIFGFEGLVRPILLGTALIDITFSVVTTVGLSYQNENRAALSAGLFIFPNLLFFIGIIFFEANIVTVFLVYGITYIINSVIIDLAVYAGGVTFAAAALNILPTPAAATVLFALLVIFFRHKTLAQARKLTLQDKAKYDALWSVLIGSVDAHKHLLSIHMKVMSFTGGLNLIQPRQCNRIGQGQFNTKGHLPSVLYGPSGTVDSLDQLFAQAICMHPILLRKVKAWALVSGGSFLVQGSHRFIQYADSLSSNVMIKFASIKSVERSIEKSVRAYGQVIQ